MKDKKYNPRLYAALCVKTDFDGMIRSVEDRDNVESYMGIGHKKFMTGYNYLKDLGLIESKDSINRVKRQIVGMKFVVFKENLLKEVIENLDDYEFKVYCYLLNKYNMHCTYNCKAKYNFSKSEILVNLGYSKAQSNLNKMENVLDKLENMGYIRYSKKRVGALGGHGTYFPLEWVKNVN